MSGIGREVKRFIIVFYPQAGRINRKSLGGWICVQCIFLPILSRGVHLMGLVPHAFMCIVPEGCGSDSCSIWLF